MQHNSCDFTPVGTFRIRVVQAQIRDEVFLVVNGQHGIGGRYRRHRDLAAASAWALSQQLLIDQLYLGLLGTLMTAKPPLIWAIPGLERAQLRGPLYLDEPTLSERPLTSEKCHSTKSLRDSPLRG